MYRKLILVILLSGIVCATPGTAGAGYLVGHWKFDGNLNDSAGTAKGVFAGGQPTYVAGKSGQAISFDGVDDFVNIPSPTNPSVYTIAAWVKPASTAAASIVVRTSAVGPTSEWSHQVRINTSGQFHHYLWVGAERNISGTTAIVPDTWYHVVIVAQTNGPMRLYVNGQEDAPSIDTAGTLWGSGDRIHVGSNSGHAMGWFKGVVDDLRIYSRELTAAQIADLSNGIEVTFPKAEKPSPADGAVGIMMPLLQWTPGETAVFDEIYLGTMPELTAADRKPRQSSMVKMYFQTVPPLVPGQTYYWRVDTVDATGKTTTGDLWSFATAPLNAWNPVPADGAKYQDPNTNLTWTGGQNAVKHEVYFSTNKDDVANAALGASKGSVSAATLELPLLTLETTYYWRVDEVEAAGTRHVGDVWSFTTTIPGLGAAKRELWLNAGGGVSVNDLLADSRYPGSPTDVNEMPDFESPADIADNYGGKLSAWLHVPVAGQYAFWVAGDDNTRLYLGADPDSAEMIAEVPSWSAAREWDKFASQKSKPIALEAGRYYLMALWKEGGGGDSCSAAWQGPGIPTRELIAGSYLMPFEALWAYGPRPRNDANETTQTPELRWTAGVKATGHQVYFSDDEQAVMDGTAGSAAYRGEQALDDTSFNPGALEFGKTYYWRVDEVSTTDADSPWTGTVWSFTTANFIVVDDFEDYVDDVEGRIFQTWIDGWGFTEPAPGNPGNGTSSTVGYTNPPFAEPTIVHGGRQSMPFDYNNIIQPYYGETDRTWTVAQNWTVNEMDTLSLWFRGNPVNFVDKGNGAFTVSASGHDIWDNADDFRFVYKRLGGDGSITAKVESLGNTNGYAKAGVMIRATLEAGSMYAIVAVSPSNGTTFEYRPFPDDAAAAGAAWSGSAIKAPYWVRLTRTGNSFNAETSPDGKTWTTSGTAQTIQMGTNLYIGLCVTSHDTAATTTAEFSGAVTTGGVTGAWQQVWIGDDPDRTNAAAQMYVAVQDSAGKVAVVNHPDLNAVLTTTWTEWPIPLTQFSGVNTRAIKKMFIGVGDRKAPQADGAGKLFIDDIRIVKPAVVGQ